MLKILLDLHGCIANFVKPFLYYHELSHLYDIWPKGVYDLKTVTGKDWWEFPAESYLQLPFMDDAEEIVELLREHSVLLGSTLSSELIAMACIMWVNTHTYGFKYTFFPGPTKAACIPIEMQQQILLIDDCDAEIDAWQGPKILLPRPWNSGEGDAVEVLRSGLETLDVSI